MRLSIFMVTLLFALTAIAADEAPAPDAARVSAWKANLEQTPFDLKSDECGVMHSLSHLAGDCKLAMVYDAKKPWSLTFKLLHDDKEIASFEGSKSSVFCSTPGVFYFARFSNDSCGCSVIAFDTATGKKIWERELSAAGSINHSKYRNAVTIRKAAHSPGDDGQKLPADLEKDTGSLVITGSEGAGDYTEVLDMKTGAMLANRVYRKP